MLLTRKKYIYSLLSAGIIHLIMLAPLLTIHVHAATPNNSEAPDLTVEGKMSRLQDYIFPGNSGIYSVKVKNIGTKKAENFGVRIRLEQEHECVSWFTLDPEETKTAWCSFDASQAGDLHVQVFVDYTYAISETNETNNEHKQTFFISPSFKRPDISVEKSITLNPTDIHTQDDIQLNAIITNKSDWPTGEFATAWYINDVAKPICRKDETLRPHESKTTFCVIENLKEEGSVLLKFAVDERDWLAETNENNNSRTVAIPVSPARSTPFKLPLQQTFGVSDTSQEQYTGTGSIKQTSFESRASKLFSNRHLERDITSEIQMRKKYINDLRLYMPLVSLETEHALTDFITYGVDDNTNKLGTGERAAVLFSYKNAFNKLPQSVDEFADVIRIANGRWPVELNLDAQNRAHGEFYKVYGRIADMSKERENAAITIMTYGLRQQAQNRNLQSEKTGIEIFEKIYDHTPSTTQEWNIMQAITYSGVTR